METHPVPDIAANLAEVSKRIDDACREAERDPNAVRLIAVSKSHDVEAVEAAIAAGHSLFGENRVQEALAKFPAIRERHPEIETHLIGPLQSNKAGDAVGFFDAIHTLDRPKIARALAKEMDKQDRRPDCLIQVNTGEEPQKAGVSPGETGDLVALCREELGLPLVGFMCIPPLEEDPAPHFAFLRELGERHGLSELSMGMSHDYESAIRFGATLVRVGTAIFGAREEPAG